MTDDDPVFVNAWTCIMGPPKMHLLCTWHVNKNWLEHLISIKNPEKRKLVRSTLYHIRTVLTEEDFKVYLENFVNDLLSDNDTEVFGKYFKTYYAPPHPDSGSGPMLFESTQVSIAICTLSHCTNRSNTAI